MVAYPTKNPLPVLSWAWGRTMVEMLKNSMLMPNRVMLYFRRSDPNQLNDDYDDAFTLVVADKQQRDDSVTEVQSKDCQYDVSATQLDAIMECTIMI